MEGDVICNHFVCQGVKNDARHWIYIFAPDDPLFSWSGVLVSCNCLAAIGLHVWNLPLPCFLRWWCLWLLLLHTVLHATRANRCAHLFSAAGRRGLFNLIFMVSISVGVFQLSVAAAIFRELIFLQSFLEDHIKFASPAPCVFLDFFCLGFAVERSRSFWWQSFRDFRWFPLLSITVFSHTIASFWCLVVFLGSFMSRLLRMGPFPYNPPICDPICHSESVSFWNVVWVGLMFALFGSGSGLSSLLVNSVAWWNGWCDAVV